MNTDIRLSIDFWRHPKTFKLEKRVGFNGPRCLQILWLWAARNRPDGVLDDMDGDDIEFVADWRGEGGAFAAALKELRWLDVDENGVMSIHNWQEHNPWAASADRRGDEARLSRLFRERPELARQLKDMGVSAISPDEYQAIKRGGFAAFAAIRPEVAATVEPALYDRSTGVLTGVPTGVVRALNDCTTTPFTPAPGPGPYITPPSPPSGGSGADAADSESGEQVESASPERTPPCPQQAIIALYHELLPACPRVRAWPERSGRQLAARWREDKARQSIDWWREAFEDIAKSDFLMGRAPTHDGRGFTFSLTWFVNPTNFAKVLNGNYQNRAAPAAGGRNIGGLEF